MTEMAAVALDASCAADPSRCGPVPVRTIGMAADRSPGGALGGRTVRSWLLLVPAAAKVCLAV